MAGPEPNKLDLLGAPEPYTIRSRNEHHSIGSRHGNVRFSMRLVIVLIALKNELRYFIAAGNALPEHLLVKLAICSLCPLVTRVFGSCPWPSS